MSVFHQTDDARQYGFRTERLSANQQPAFTIDCAAGDLVARLFRHRQAFAADQGFVGVALAIHHFSVHREALAGLDQHLVAELERADGDVFFAAVDHANRPLRP